MSNEYLDKHGLQTLWNDALTVLAPLASPALTGTPTAPTAAAGTSTTQVATTAFVSGEVDAATTPMTRAEILQVTSADTGTQS